MPTSNNTSSPVKRPGLGRRSVSSHAAISTRPSPSNQAELSHSHTQKAPVHKLHRPHVVGGAHRAHARNPSFGKNLNKLQKLTFAHNLGEGATTTAGARHHQRKKSAPVTPAASPRGHHHVRWDSTTATFGDHKTNPSMKKNYSSPALRRNTSTVIGKKALVTDRPHAVKGQAKKVVGFELGYSDDEGEWEDSTQSPESTRRNSVAPKDSAENNTVLVDPLTFVKRPYPQPPQASSLPEQSSASLAQEDHHPDKEEQASEDREQRMRTGEHEDLASRFLNQSRSSKAPPAMSSISAMAKPATVDPTPRTTSLSNITSSHDATRRAPISAANSASTPGNNTQGTSSSMEGGVSRFIINDKSGQSRTDSDPNTPSSFLPHYHPQTPPSPGHAVPTRTKASPPPRPPGGEPPSRTQQKLWLQRTAALTTSPPDSHGPGTTMAPSAMDPAFMAAAHSRPGSRPYDGGRGMNGSARAGGAVHDSEAKHIRKAFEKTASELNVVRRFQSPTKDSFSRVSRIMNELERPATGTAQNQSLTKAVKSAPALTNMQSTPERKQQGRIMSQGNNDSETGLTQLISKNKGPKMSASRVYIQDQDDIVNIGDSAEPVDRLGVDHQSHGQHPTHPALSSSDDAVHGAVNEGFFLDETAMMIRRMWESREVPTAG
ncbi:hypothetical protein VTN02DRAFT_2819 [Thermoascus thermophilus]